MFISKLLTKIIQIISVEKSLLVGYLKIINKFEMNERGESNFSR